MVYLYPKTENTKVFFKLVIEIKRNTHLDYTRLINIKISSVDSHGMCGIFRQNLDYFHYESLEGASHFSGD